MTGQHTQMLPGFNYCMKGTAGLTMLPELTDILLEIYPSIEHLMFPWVKFTFDSIKWSNSPLSLYKVAHWEYWEWSIWKKYLKGTSLMLLMYYVHVPPYEIYYLCRIITSGNIILSLLIIRENTIFRITKGLNISQN